MNVKGLLKKVTVLEDKFKALLPQLLAVRAELEDAMAAATAVGNASETPAKTAAVAKPVRKERKVRVAEKPARQPRGTKVTKVVKTKVKAKAKKVAGLKPTTTDLKRKANKVIAAKAGERVKAKRKSKKK